MLDKIAENELVNEVEEERQFNPENIVEIRNLTIHYETQDAVFEAVNNVSLDLKKGKVLGLVGETGAGKTTIALSIIGLLPFPPTNIIQGEILFEGEDLLKKSEKEMRFVRGDKIGMIFQDPMTALNPMMRIGDQVREVIELHNDVSKAEAEKMAKDMLQIVGIQPDRYKDYPHQFSGGMKQRVIIAIALACKPELLIADEPTTALDVTIQAQVLELMKNLQRDMGTAMLLITHDFGVVADICDDCMVIYAGEIIEKGSVEDIFDRGMHPYTVGLFGSIPNLDKEVERLNSIKGLMSDPTQLPSYCSFYERCDKRMDRCCECDPVPVEVAPGHFVKCLLFEKEQTGHEE